MDGPNRGRGLAELIHFGVKGMKWGVRKADKSSGPQSVQVKAYLGNRVVRTTGGKGHDLSDDAKRAAVLKQKSRKSNVRSLSNKELQDLVNRMNLEQQYSRLNKDVLKRGEEQARSILSVAQVAKQAYSEIQKVRS